MSPASELDLTLENIIKGHKELQGNVELALNDIRSQQSAVGSSSQSEPLEWGEGETKFSSSDTCFSVSYPHRIHDAMIRLVNTAKRAIRHASQVGNHTETEKTNLLLVCVLTQAMAFLTSEPWVEEWESLKGAFVDSGNTGQELGKEDPAF